MTTFKGKNVGKYSLHGAFGAFKYIGLILRRDTCKQTKCKTKKILDFI